MDSCTPFVRSWQSTLKLKRVYEALRARTASIPKLPMGLFGITNTPHAATAAVESDATPVPLHIRLGVPTLDSACDNLLATPPSLAWALAVTMEFYRLQAEYGMSSNLETNLTVETVGVLENWIEFFTYGSLLTDGSMKSTFIDKAWVGGQTNFGFKKVHNFAFVQPYICSNMPRAFLPASRLCRNILCSVLPNSL